MKNLLTVAVVLGFALSFVGCGTEDDPTIGIDEQEGVGYGEEAAVSPLRCEVVNMKLTGKCATTAPACVLYTTTQCPVGASALRPTLQPGCYPPGSPLKWMYDANRTCVAQ